MFRLDGALAAAFKGTAQAKKKQEQEKEMQLRHYKMRYSHSVLQFFAYTKS
jgi:hypothetical protein